MIIHGDCIEAMKDIDDNSIDLIVTDPPYFKVKNEWWDRQWDNADKFIEWIGLLCKQWYRILKPNGGLYVFASPKMAARVEVKIGKTFNVLNRVIWAKPSPNSLLNYGAARSGQVDIGTLRSYFPESETIVFAEHYDSDNIKISVFEPLRAYISEEIMRTGLSNKQINEQLGTAITGSGMAGHYTKKSGQVQWSLPTEKSYQKLQRALNPNSNNEYLKREYEDLRYEYEYLWQEYEDLRRPFNATSETQYTDVWTFSTVSHFKGKHPCEKPIELIEHIIRMSSNEGAMILDCFMGRGTTLEAARNLNRQAIGIEISEKWCKATEARLSQLKMEV